MNKRKKIIDVKKQSMVIPSSEASFFSKSSIESQFPNVDKKLSDSDRQKLLNAYYGHSPIANPEKSRSKEKSPFVVDWQMPDEH